MNFEISIVDIDRINIDPKYQRTLDVKRIAKIAEAFSAGAIKAISLSRRADGSLWVYDGMHSVEVMRKMGLTQVPAVIVSGSQKQEAAWFNLMNGAGVRKASQRDGQKAGVVAGDKGALRIQELLGSYGVEIAKGGARKGTTSAIGSIKVWIKADHARLVRAMDMIDRLWCSEDHAWTQIVIRGAWDVAGTDKLAAVEAGLVKQKVTPRRILDVAGAMQSATGTGGGGSGYSKKAFYSLAKVAE
jgi:ParB-like chromosome segregation protein Spo0J